MATSLAAQLAEVAANSKSSLNVKAQKAAHSKSLIWEPRVAASQNYQTLYTTCHQGFEELCQLDPRFARFESTIFSVESQNQDRTQLSKAENEELDKQIDAFLRLAGSRLRLMPAIKAIEWLIRRFRIHEENMSALLKTFLPYHSIPAFATLLSILPRQIVPEFRFLDPYIRSQTCPPRSVLVHQAVHHPDFLTLVSEYTLESCRMQFQHPTLISFWGGLMTEAISGILDRNRSGRAAVQRENDQTLIHRLGPIFVESLSMQKVPSLQIASYMALSILISKGNLEDVAVMAFMEQTALNWTNDTVRPGLVCLAIMAQHRSAKQVSKKITRSLLKIVDIGPLLVEVGQQRRVDKLANGLCLALVDRFSKKGDSRGLATVMAILESRILKDQQIGVIFKSLLVTAHELNDESDADGSLRRELGSALIALSHTPGDSGDVIQSVIQDMQFDIEQLEMKLDLSFRSRKLPETVQEDMAMDMANAESETNAPKDLNLALEEIAAGKGGISGCLLPQPGEIFDEFSHLFFSVVSQQASDPKLLEQFDQQQKLQRTKALETCTYVSFFIRIWCGPYPALARVAALEMVKNRVKEEESVKTDLQAIIPYGLAALGDPSKRVRQAASALMIVLAETYGSSASGSKTWGNGALYGDRKVTTITSEVAARVLHLQVLPALEECILDPTLISTIIGTAIETGKYHSKPDPSVEKKDHMAQSARTSLLTFLSAHAVATPFLLVKDRLLQSLNQTKGVSGTSRTKVLLPALKWWAELKEEEAEEKCKEEQLEQSTLDSRFVDVLVPNEISGIDFVFEALKNPKTRQRDGLVEAIFNRIRKMWADLKDDVKFTVAAQLLEFSQEAITAEEDPAASLVSGEAADLLRSVPLTTDILSSFLDTIKTGTKMITEPPPNKRRRTSSTEGNRGLVTQASSELSSALRRITFVLQLLENSEPINHPELLDGLFTALSELQHFRTVVGSELGYLQNLILRSLLAMMPAYKNNKDLKITAKGGYGDLLVNCIQKSSSPVVQNAALLLIASLATTAPSLVLHSVMPIFTFMGTSVLRQSDDYSAHVVAQTIKEVVPPLIASLRSGKKSPVAGASEILVSFTTAYEHIPSHRREDLFVALVETLGAPEFLFALVAMLVDRYGPSDALLQFAINLMNRFTLEVQMESLVQLWDLISDLFKPKPTISFQLLGITEDGSEKDVEQIAFRQLSAFPTFLSNKKLRSEISQLEGQDDMEASEVRTQYSNLLESVLLLADQIKDNKNLHTRCGATLANLLNLLSIGEFIESVENLLDRPDMGLRQKVLRALEVRVDKESTASAASRTALLAFLPQLTAAIRESPDSRYKHTAVTCVDKIAEKYGKKDIEAVVAAAETIAGKHCLGQDDQRLRVMALLCLTSLVDVLQDAVVPVLPVAIPTAVQYLHLSLQGEVDSELHSACYGFLSSLAEHLPYMLSNHVDKILDFSNLSAEVALDEETKHVRISCLQFIAKQLAPKDVFTSYQKNWDHAASTGYNAAGEYLDILGVAIDKHTKASISKNSSTLATIITQALDLRRQKVTTSNIGEVELRQIDAIEANLYEKALKMIYKLNDASFRPIFTQILEWTQSGLGKSDEVGLRARQHSVFGFFETFFETLKSIVTSYFTYVLDDAVSILDKVNPKEVSQRRLWTRVLSTLAKSFEHDQDEFWQAPGRFNTILPILSAQFLHAPTIDIQPDLIPALVELAVASDSQAHQKELNGALMKCLKSEQKAIRLAAVKTQQALTDRLGEEWLSMLHEMLPRISELQEDDDEEVERETHRWIVKIEGVLGESLDSMLQ